MFTNHLHLIIIGRLYWDKLNSAAVVRMLNYAKALYSENVLTHFITPLRITSFTYLKDETGNFILHNESGCAEAIKKTNRFIRLIKFLNLLNSQKNQYTNRCFLLYPTDDWLFTIFIFIYIKIFKHERLYLELNEIRRFIFNFNIKYFSTYNNIYKKYIHTLVDCLIPYYDGIIVISTNIENRFINTAKKSIRIPILADSKVIRITPKKYSSNKFMIGFSGSIDFRKEDLASLIHGIFDLEEKGISIQLNLCGPIYSKKAKTTLSKYLSNQMSKTIVYHGNLNHENVLGFLRENHLLVLPRKRSEQSNYGFSTKLAEYLSSCVPVLVTDVSDNSLYIRDSINGFLVSPNNSIELVNKLISIIRDYNNICNFIGENGYQTAINSLGYENYGLKLKSFLFA